MPTFEDARRIAVENVSSNPTVERTIWFEDEDVLRIIYVDQDTLPSPDVVQVFAFGANPTEGLDTALEVAVVRPDEVNHAELPGTWGDWRLGQVVYERAA